MIFILSNGKQIRGDLVRRAIIRSDLSPVPVTLEADFVAGDDDFDSLLAQGKTLKAPNGDTFQIVKSSRIIGRDGDKNGRKNELFSIIGLLQNCLPVSKALKRAIIKENAHLSEIYRAAGCVIKSVEADFPIPRFYCYVGETPSFQIAQVLQDEGGVVRWKNQRLQFMRSPDLFKQKPVLTMPSNAAVDTTVDFLEKHQVPWYFSVNPSGNLIFGDRDKERPAVFSPAKTVQKLNNLSRVLIQRRVVKILLNVTICAGDIIQFSDGKLYTVITAAHCFASGTGGENGIQTSTRLWLGELG